MATVNVAIRPSHNSAEGRRVLVCTTHIIEMAIVPPRVVLSHNPSFFGAPPRHATAYCSLRRRDFRRSSIRSFVASGVPAPEFEMEKKQLQEKKRRDKINKLLEKLKNYVVMYFPQDGSKLEQADVLEKVVVIINRTQNGGPGKSIRYGSHFSDSTRTTPSPNFNDSDRRAKKQQLERDRRLRMKKAVEVLRSFLVQHRPQDKSRMYAKLEKADVLQGVLNYLDQCHGSPPELQNPGLELRNPESELLLAPRFDIFNLLLWTPNLGPKEPGYDSSSSPISSEASVSSLESPQNTCKGSQKPLEKSLTPPTTPRIWQPWL
ncbi:unnamed protein product [Caenorhabditis auriculariae]|uniref:BHLH domain-containing protein n=1 Tax=Caenorhabditis auriculariae TaxID=2777116 RepID=A0A8S1HJS9_9PELO|nr:unnamed protein product [Caenorhabditis auriculariae]